MDVAVIGGGAAGFFSAINVKENFPESRVIIFEKSRKYLSKVRVSGGGRCNVTNGTPNTSALLKGYPRGSQCLKRLFRTFNNKDVMAWFESRSVTLKTEDDGRVFPQSDNSETIIRCLLNEIQQRGIQISMQKEVKQIIREGDQIVLHFKGTDSKPQSFDNVIVTTGGSPKLQGLQWLAEIGHQIIPPVPSLFTFNMPGETITGLMGVVIENALVRIEGSRHETSGPVLITHWGMSGPAILRLSSFAARDLHATKYNFRIRINWVNIKNQDDVASMVQSIFSENPQKQLGNLRPLELPSRFWHYIIDRAGMEQNKKVLNFGRKSINKLVTILTNDQYYVSGKTTFKEEFVTCGGVSLESINQSTMESLVVPGLYFAGEILDIDGITGGYNFQAAWTTAYVAGQLM